MPRIICLLPPLFALNALCGAACNSSDAAGPLPDAALVADALAPTDDGTDGMRPDTGMPASDLGTAPSDGSLGDDGGAADGGAPSTRDYFTLLQERDEHMHSRAYRSEAEIATDQTPRATHVRYDAVQDAAEWTFRANVGSMSSADQLRSEFTPPVGEPDRNALYYWEGRWDGNWMRQRDGIRTHKAFQITGIEPTRQGRGLEPRTRFDLAPEGYVARVDMRVYGWDPVVEGPFDTIGELDASFDIAPDTWTRFWVFVDWANLAVTMWVSDETRAPVRIYDETAFNSMAPSTFSGFWFEYNSSQERSDPSTLRIWGRNLVVLVGLDSLEIAEQLVGLSESGR
ncbi:MAG: hypothetical protein AAF938_17450 [Myxococcota bacterium]